MIDWTFLTNELRQQAGDHGNPPEYGNQKNSTKTGKHEFWSPDGGRFDLESYNNHQKRMSYDMKKKNENSTETGEYVNSFHHESPRNATRKLRKFNGNGANTWPQKPPYGSQTDQRKVATVAKTKAPPSGSILDDANSADKWSI